MQDVMKVNDADADRVAWNGLAPVRGRTCRSDVGSQPLGSLDACKQASTHCYANRLGYQPPLDLRNLERQRHSACSETASIAHGPASSENDESRSDPP